MFRHADDANELKIPNRSAELVEFRTKPIPKNFWHSFPDRTELWMAIPQAPIMKLNLR